MRKYELSVTDFQWWEQILFYNFSIVKSAFTPIFIILLSSVIFLWCTFSDKQNKNEATDQNIILSPAISPNTITEINAKEEVSDEQKLVKYTDTKNWFEMMIPKEYTLLSESHSEKTNECIEGEVLNFYVYKKDNAPSNLDGALWIYEFSGKISSPDYRALENSKKDGSFCGPVYNTDEILSLFEADNYDLKSTSLQVLKPIQSASCDIQQIIKLSRQNGDVFEMSMPVTSIYEAEEANSLSENWKSKCPILFEKNNSSELQKKILDFEKIAQSVKFL